MLHDIKAIFSSAGPRQTNTHVVRSAFDFVEWWYYSTDRDSSIGDVERMFKKMLPGTIIDYMAIANSWWVSRTSVPDHGRLSSWESDIPLQRVKRKKTIVCESTRWNNCGCFLTILHYYTHQCRSITEIKRTPTPTFCTGEGVWTNRFFRSNAPMRCNLWTFWKSKK